MKKEIKFNYLNIILILLLVLILYGDYYWYKNTDDLFLFTFGNIFLLLPLSIIEEKLKIFTNLLKVLTKERTIRL